MTQISRGDFLKFLGMVTLSPFVHISLIEQKEDILRARMRKVYLQTVHIAGFYYYDGMDEDVYDGLSAGDELELRREPQNPHDANAIEVYTRDGWKLGYVPRINNPIPASIADQNVAIGAEIAYLESDPEEYPPVSMRLYMVILTDSDHS